MSEKVPYMPLYVDDFESHTTHLTLEEDGIYNRLLRLLWRTPGCTVPFEEKWLCRRLRVTVIEYNEKVMPIIDEFFSTRSGRLFQKRQYQIYKDINDKILARKTAGKAGAKAKALKALQKAQGKGNDLLEANAQQKPSIQNQNQNHIYKKLYKKGELDSEVLDLLFAEWAELYPRDGAKMRTKAMYEKALSQITPADLLAITQDWIAAWQRERTPKEYINDPGNWLHDEKWNDPLPGYVGSVDDQMDEDEKHNRNIVRMWLEGKIEWSNSSWGPPPNDPNTRIDGYILREFGIDENTPTPERDG